MAQLVARLVRNEKAGGSNPPSSTRCTRLEPLPSSMVSVRALLLSWAQVRALVLGVEERLEGAVVLGAEVVVFVPRQIVGRVPDSGKFGDGEVGQVVVGR